MRLTCPRCGAQYEIDGSAIPAAGRAVECSACGHVWHHAPAAQGGHAARPAPAAARAGEPPASALDPFVASERPQLHRRLDESVLSVLREEAAREIDARRRDVAPDGEQDDPDYSPPPLPAPGTDPATDAATGVAPPGKSAEEQFWPATTLTHAAPRASANILARRLEADLEAEPAANGQQSEDTGREPAQRPPPNPAASPSPPDAIAPARVDTVQPPADTITAPADPFPTQRPPVTARVAPPHAPPATAPNLQPSTASPLSEPISAHPQHTRRGRRSGYAAGFGLAVMAALILLALYALAPRVADQGELGARLMEYRAEADRGRAWLEGRADALVSGMRE